MAKHKNKAKTLSPEVKAFIAGKSDQVTLPRPKTALGYSPALEQSGMSRRPTVRDEHHKNRKATKQQLKDYQD